MFHKSWRQPVLFCRNFEATCGAQLTTEIILVIWNLSKCSTCENLKFDAVVGSIFEISNYLKYLVNIFCEILLLLTFLLKFVHRNVLMLSILCWCLAEKCVWIFVI